MSFVANPTNRHQGPRHGRDLEDAPDVVALVVAKVERLLAEVRNCPSVTKEKGLATLATWGLLEHIPRAVGR